MHRKTLTVLSACTLLLAAACGSNGSGTSSNSDSATGGTSNQGAPAATQAPAKANDTVKVWTYPIYATYEDDLKVLIENIEKQYPWIKVEYEMLSWAEGPQKFDLALNAGSPPDLYFHSVDGAYLDTGLAVQLDPYMTDEIRADYKEGVLELGQINGGQYGLPIYTYQWAWGGNKRILEEAGIDYLSIQQNGWTWSEFLEIAEKLTTTLPDGGKRYAITTDGTSLDFIELLTRANGIPDVLNTDGEFQWGDERILETMKFIETLIQKGYMPAETGALTPAQRTEMLYNGTTALISKAIPYYDVTIANRNADIDAGKIQGEKIEFVLLPVPHGDNQPEASIMGAEGYVMFNQKKDQGEEHRQNVFLVMEGLSGAEAGMASNELVLPFVRYSQEKLFEGKGKGTENTIATAKRLAEVMAMPVTLNLDVEKAAQQKQFKEQVVKPNIQALYAGEKTAEEVAEAYKSQASRFFR